MNSLRLAALLSVSLGLMACPPRKIPGTEIDDTDDARAVLNTMESYRKGVEKRDAEAITRLIDESFKDDGGNTDPGDNLVYKDLPGKLKERFDKLDDVRLEMTVRRLEMDKDEQVARATYTFTITWRLPGLTNRTQRESDVKQMILRRHEKNDWRIVSGI